MTLTGFSYPVDDLWFTCFQKVLDALVSSLSTLSPPDKGYFQERRHAHWIWYLSTFLLQSFKEVTFSRHGMAKIRTHLALSNKRSTIRSFSKKKVNQFIFLTTTTIIYWINRVELGLWFYEAWNISEISRGGQIYGQAGTGKSPGRFRTFLVLQYSYKLIHVQ